MTRAILQRKNNERRKVTMIMTTISKFSNEFMILSSTECRDWKSKFNTG